MGLWWGIPGLMPGRFSVHRVDRADERHKKHKEERKKRNVVGNQDSTRIRICVFVFFFVLFVVEQTSSPT
jgi:hypothetical protein